MAFVPIKMGRFPVVSSIDGAYYFLRLKTALQGDPIISCPFDANLKSSQTFIPSMMEDLWAAAIRPFTGTNIRSAIIITYIVLPASLFCLLVFFLTLVFHQPALAILVGFWGMTSGAVLYWKPFLFFTSIPLDEPLPYFRYANPMLLQIPFLLTFGTSFYYFNSIEKRGVGHVPNWLFGAVFGLVGLLFYVQMFYAVYFMVTLFIFILLSGWHGKRSVLQLGMGVLLAGGLLGLPELIKNVHILSTPGVFEVVHRIGCLVENQTPYYLFHKGLWTTFLVYQVLSWKHWNLRWAFLTASMIGGYVCLNQTAISGLSSHDHHYFRPMMISYVFVVMDCLVRFFEQYPKTTGRRLVVVSASALVVLILTVNASLALVSSVRTQGAPPQSPLEKPGLQQTLAHIKKLPDSDKNLMLADPTLTYFLEILGDATVYINQYFYHCIMPDEALFSRWALLGKFRGWTQRDVTLMLDDFIKKLSVTFWLYGLPEQYTGPKNRYSEEDLQKRAEVWASTYTSRKIEDLILEKRFKGALPNTALITPQFPLKLELLQKFFRMKLLFQVPEEGTQLWKLEKLI